MLILYLNIQVIKYKQNNEKMFSTISKPSPGLFFFFRWIQTISPGV